jgi:hypothetical protein
VCVSSQTGTDPVEFGIVATKFFERCIKDFKAPTAPLTEFANVPKVRNGWPIG